MTFFILTFGCKVNQCESEDIIFAMRKCGYVLCDSFQKADIVIINSCAVTSESVRKVRRAVNKVRAKNKNCVMILTGCFPQAEPMDAQRVFGVDIVIGNKEKSDITSIIATYLDNKKSVFNVSNILDLKVFQNNATNCEPARSRAFLKIEDGCNRFCSYCIIPYARGRVRSKSLESIANDAGLLAKSGYKEIVLVGINLLSYGMDIQKNIADAVDAICAIEGVKRVRMGSLEPDLITEDVLRRLANQPKLCSQFHLALQSGSNKILKSMRRRYNRKEYMDVVETIRKYFKNPTFTTDLMVGFPGENQEDFEDSLSILNDVGFLKVHVFPYSVRPGTLAEKFENQIEKKIKFERAKKAMEVSGKIRQDVLNSFSGGTFDVLYETVSKDGFYEGYTKEYISVKAKCDRDLRGKIIPSKFEKIQGDCVICKPLLN